VNVTPLHVTVLALPAREVEPSPSLDLVHVGNLLGAVVLVNFGGHERLSVAAVARVRQHRIELWDKRKKWRRWQRGEMGKREKRTQRQPCG
jgi:hypothetical protein